MADKNNYTPLGREDHLNPGPIDPAVINEELDILRCLEKERNEERILKLQKVKSEQVFDATMDIWEVQTDQNGYWVITNPTRTYIRTQYPSFDYALTFHVGLKYRVASQQWEEQTMLGQDPLGVPWLLWEKAVVALDQAAKETDLPVVGTLCRNCLLSMVKTVRANEWIPLGPDQPDTADFIAWSVYIAEVLAPTPGEAPVQLYLKAVAQSAWQMVDWLIQAEKATKRDGNMVIEASETVLMAFGSAILRNKRD